MSDITKIIIMLFLVLQPSPVYRWRHIAINGEVFIDGKSTTKFATLETWVGDSIPHVGR